ncbi:MAG TPA: HAD family phosphatase [Candidatus Nitrosotalea sp.]|nr:HAD family phosphatase [Candidatus Nitrosotalea sp.]
MQWIIFDLDGTLIESEEIWAGVRRRFVIENGGRWNERAQAEMMGMRTTEWARYMHDTLGVAQSPDKIELRIADAMIERFAQRVPVLPDADAVLERCAEAFRLGVATSSPLRVAGAVLAATGWSRLFEVVVSADSVASGKPAPDVYLRAIELLDAEPMLTVAVEDSAAGIRAARAAQLSVVAIPNRSYPPDADSLALATRVVGSLAQLDLDDLRSVAT